MALQHDFGAGGHAQCAAQRFDQFGAFATQQAGKLVFRQAVRHGRDRAQNGGRIRAQRHAHRVRLAGVERTVLFEVQRAATVWQPAHDDFVARQDLLAVNTQVLPRFVRALGDDQAPGNERGHVSGPAVLHRQAGQVHVRALPDHILAGGRAQFLGRHVPERFNHRAQAHQVFEAFGRLRLLEHRQQVSELAHLGEVGHTHAQGDAARGAKQISQDGDAVPGRILEQQRRPACAQSAVAQGGHFQVG